MKALTAYLTVFFLFGASMAESSFCYTVILLNTEIVCTPVENSKPIPRSMPASSCCGSAEVISCAPEESLPAPEEICEEIKCEIDLAGCIGFQERCHTIWHSPEMTSILNERRGTVRNHTVALRQPHIADYYNSATASVAVNSRPRGVHPTISTTVMLC